VDRPVRSAYRKVDSPLISAIRVFLVGDVVGRSGCRALFMSLQSLVKETRADAVIANGENAADGLGLTPDLAEGMFKSGVDVITSGNHIWQKREILPLLDSEARLLRPENYPSGVPGHGSCVVNKKGVELAVLNLQGRQSMHSLRCPFVVGLEQARRLRNRTKVLVVDFHAEASEEKEALCLYLDGSVSAVIGTHTHVQTADERILPQGTACLTDVGMTGPASGVIGMKAEISINRALTQIPYKMEVADEESVVSGVLVEVDVATGRSLSITRVSHEMPPLG
jgi:metallophosphoesterase (TIGR00282 family)